MTPPPTAALALLGVWGALLFWATSTAATDQSRVDEILEIVVSEPQRDQPDEPSTTDASEASFSAADD